MGGVIPRRRHFQHGGIFPIWKEKPPKDKHSTSASPGVLTEGAVGTDCQTNFTGPFTGFGAETHHIASYAFLKCMDSCFQ
jgi:hypothetical protein